MSEQAISNLDHELKIIVGRIVLLESALGTVITSRLPSDVVGEIVSHLEVVNSGLLSTGIPPILASILSVIKDGPNESGPGIKIVKN